MKWLVQYWAQIAVVIAAIGYLIKVLLDHKFRRKEIGYTVFTKGKLDAVTAILETYEAAQDEALKRLYLHFSTERLIGGYVDNKSTLEALSDRLTKQREHLKFFCTDREYSLFSSLTINFHLIEGAMFVYSTTKQLKEGSHKEWFEQQRGILSKNASVVSEIISSLQKVFM